MSIPNFRFVHTYVPAATNDSTRTLVLLHGTGGNEEDLIPLGKALAPGAALLGVRGNVLEGSAPRFFRRLAEGVFDEDDIVLQSRALANFLEKAAEHYGFTMEGLVAVGYSNGANIAASLLLLHPNTLGGAVLFRSMLPLVPPTLPSLDGKRILMESGRMDPIVPADSVERLKHIFEECKADVSLNWNNASHGLTNPEILRASRWLQG